MYIPNATYTSSRWADYYDGSVSSSSPDYNYSGPGIKSNYTEMLTTYAALSSADQANNYVFLQLGKVILSDQTSQMVDLWGDIPFFKSNSLNSSRTISDAPYDNAETVYDSIIGYLKDVNAYLDTVNLSSVVATSLAKQDLIYGGNLTKWRMYANSLRLRLLMRISNYNESMAKTEVTTMLNDPSTYPLINDNADNAQFNQSPSTIQSSLSGAISLAPYAPAYLLDTVMNLNNDPRIPVYWDANASGQYVGFSSSSTAADYSTAVSNRSLATIDSATFIYNYNLPGILFNAAETDFLIAEAYERWGLGDASVPYYAGIDQSIAFYYKINQTRILSSGSWPVLASPSAASISSFKGKSAVLYSGTTTQKLTKIYTQKWAHFFILQAQQAWAEYRRTGYPVLNFYVNTGSANAINPPSRLLYPSEQSLYNNANYLQVASKDTRSGKVFWDVN
ncbi:MAG: hypothetical protein DI598_09245 [Pseudopedobacter saltans]|uniref:SusD/RagB family nutrient-binding outer membrane lipoprotein n=1 Tax=Pseudopedobacter saltans TaxID=151895 RepID=A0A2W5H4P6_9SPHI|nr:MAG: hypothetical protein DI598_09245 [Pseudopedobacter saltans]